MKRAFVDTVDERGCTWPSSLGKPLLSYLLQWAWQDTQRLALVCKAFAAATQDRYGYWLPVVKRELLRRFPTHAAVVAMVNPFMEFPRALYTHPPLPWWHWITWLFGAKRTWVKLSFYNDSRFTGIFVYDAEMEIDFLCTSFCSHTKVYTCRDPRRGKTIYGASYGYVVKKYNRGWVKCNDETITYLDGEMWSGKKLCWRRFRGDVTETDERYFYPNSGFIKE
jgi:hypothetical protein